jgi:acetylornithine deacetylase/succinyl-diaminopimelate desuccinylase-like protein
MTAPEELRHKAAAMMPELLADLERLVAIPSVAFPGYPPEPVAQMADESLRLFREAGLANAELQKVPSGCPPVYGDLPGPDGAPTVVLYAHYDVQPAHSSVSSTANSYAPN